MDNFNIARENMIKGQVTPNKITDKKIIEVLASTPRHLFVPDSLKGIAYSDEVLFLSEDRYLMPPMVFARMLQAAEIKETDNLLDVACGSGYSSAVIAQLARKAVAIESDPELATRANFIINKLDLDNVIVLNARIIQGHEDGAPYDVIFVNGAVPKTPHDLLEQLAEGGRLVVVLNGKAVIFTRKNNSINRRDLFEIELPVIAGFEEDSVHAN